MTDTITITGLVGTDPRHRLSGGILPITSFRLASTQRRFDRSQNRWVDADTNWYTISTFRQLAVNAAASIKKGERIVVTGRLRIKEWQSGEKSGTEIDIEADALGHDLSWGTAQWVRVSQSTSVVSSAQDESFPGAFEPSSQSSTAARLGSSEVNGGGFDVVRGDDGLRDSGDIEGDRVGDDGGDDVHSHDAELRFASGGVATPF